MAAKVSAPGRFIDDRQKYLLFANTCSEKRETARHIGRVIPQLAPRPPAMKLYQVGAGEGTLLTLLLRQIHHHFPRIPVLVVIKENDPDVIRGALRHLADRFNEHPQLVLVLTNMAYPDAGLGPLVAGGGCARCKTLAMAGEASAAFEAQINAALSYVDSTWGPPARRGAAARKGEAALVLYRADWAFALDEVIPRLGSLPLSYDLVVASQPYRSRLPAEIKVRSLLKPLALALSPGGRLILVQAAGGDGGAAIASRLWPEDNPFPTPVADLIAELQNQLGSAWADFELFDGAPEGGDFDYRLRLDPAEGQSVIGTSSLLAAWNAAAYVAQIDEGRLNAVMLDGRYLEVTRAVLAEQQGLFFRNESFQLRRLP